MYRQSLNVVQDWSPSTSDRNEASETLLTANNPLPTTNSFVDHNQTMMQLLQGDSNTTQNVPNSQTLLRPYYPIPTENSSGSGSLVSGSFVDHNQTSQLQVSDSTHNLLHSDTLPIPITAYNPLPTTNSFVDHNQTSQLQVSDSTHNLLHSDTLPIPITAYNPLPTKERKLGRPPGSKNKNKIPATVTAATTSLSTEEVNKPPATEKVKKKTVTKTIKKPPATEEEDHDVAIMADSAGEQFTDEAIQYLLQWYPDGKKVIADKRSHMEVSKVYGELAQDINTRFNLKLDKSHVKNKLHNLKSAYRTALRKENVSGNPPSNYEWLNESQTAFQGDADVKPELLIQSGCDTIVTSTPRTRQGRAASALSLQQTQLQALDEKREHRLQRNEERKTEREETREFRSQFLAIMGKMAEKL